jgi:hypothetical protein
MKDAEDEDEDEDEENAILGRPDCGVNDEEAGRGEGLGLRSYLWVVGALWVRRSHPIDKRSLSGSGVAAPDFPGQ